MRRRPLWLWATLMLCAAPGWSEERVLTLADALALARERGLAVVLARGRVEEARAGQLQAARRFQENPVLEANGGLRRAGDDFFDFEAAVTQGLYTGRRRSARLAGAKATVERAEAELAETRRQLMGEVRSGFVRALGGRDRAELLGRSRRAADELLTATERTYEAGEATALELNRARTAAASARAAQSAAEAEEASALSGLAALLGLGAGETVEIRGDLAPPPPIDLQTLLAGLDRRPDLQALAAELREAEAEILLGQALRSPEVGVRGGLAREEKADIVTAGIVVALPVHDRGQQAIASGQARAAALRQALAATRGAAEAEVRGAYSALARRLAAVRELESTALPALEDNESLALKSW